MDFADYREYVPGDDLRRVDIHAYARLGKRLVKLYEAEDEAALRVVLDLSGSMGFGAKLAVARAVAAGFAVVATGGGDRVRVLLCGGEGVDAGPWFRGGVALPAVDARLASVSAGGVANLPAALARAVGDGPRGPVVLISDLLFDGWEDAVDALGLGRADTCLVHVLGRDDIEPDLDGDLRLADVESGAEVEVGIAGAALGDYRGIVERWRDDVRAACGARGIAYAPLIDDESVEDFFLTRLPATGLVA